MGRSAHAGTDQELSGATRRECGARARVGARHEGVMADRVRRRRGRGAPRRHKPLARDGDAAAVGLPSGAGAMIAQTRAAGLVAVHQAEAKEDLTVISVSADPDIPRDRVLDATHEVAACTRSGREVPTRSLSTSRSGAATLGVSTSARSARGSRESSSSASRASAFRRGTSRQPCARSVPAVRFGAGTGDDGRLDLRSRWRHRCTAGGPCVIYALRLRSGRRNGVREGGGGLPRAGRARDRAHGDPAFRSPVRGTGDRGRTGATGNTGRGAQAGSSFTGLPLFTAWVAVPEEAEE